MLYWGYIRTSSEKVKSLIWHVCTLLCIMTGLVVSHDVVNIMVGGLIPSQLARVYHMGVPSAFQYSLWFRVVWLSQWVACATWPLPLWGDHIAFSKIIVVH